MRNNGWIVTVLALLLASMIIAACAEDADDDVVEDEPDEVTDDDDAEPDDTDVDDDEDDAADEVAEFYEGNTVTIILGAAPGGGFDAVARILAPALERHIPGEPTVAVDNMPGAGHVLAMNHLYNTAERDGSVIGNTGGGLAIDQAFDDPSVNFDLEDLRFLGQPRPPINTVLVAHADAGITDITDTFGDDGAELVVGAAEPGSMQTDPAVLVQQVLGANLNIVTGYESTAPMALAVEQREIDAFQAPWDSFVGLHHEELESGEWIPLFQMIESDDELLEGVPTIDSLTDDENEQELLVAGAAARTIVQPYFVPPEVPEERAAALEEAFAAAVADPEVQAQAEEADMELELVPPDEVREALLAIAHMPEDMRERLREPLGR